MFHNTALPLSFFYDAMRVYMLCCVSGCAMHTVRTGNIIDLKCLKHLNIHINLSCIYTRYIIYLDSARIVERMYLHFCSFAGWPMTQTFMIVILFVQR